MAVFVVILETPTGGCVRDLGVGIPDVSTFWNKEYMVRQRAVAVL